METQYVALTSAPNLSSSLANAISDPRALGVVDAYGYFALVGETTNQCGGKNMRSGTTDGREQRHILFRRRPDQHHSNRHPSINS
jgi:hypothetical protein